MPFKLTWKGPYVERQVRARLERIVTTEIGPAALSRVRELTPVDTGRLRAGWRGIADIQRIRYMLLNDVPYCPHVEWGARGRAGVGMGRRTMDEFAPLLKQALERAAGR